MENQGQNPVILISLRNAEAENWEDSFFNTKNLVKSLYKQFQYIKEKLDEFDLEDFLSIVKDKDLSLIHICFVWDFNAIY